MSKPLVFGEGNILQPGTVGVTVIGNNNQVAGVFDGTTFINSNGQELSNENGEWDGKTVINDGALVIDTAGNTTGLFSFEVVVVDSDITITSGTKYTLFTIDANTGNIDITIDHSPIPRLFVRTDGSANVVTLYASSGDIGASASLNVILNDFFTIVSNGTKMFYK